MKKYIILGLLISAILCSCGMNNETSPNISTEETRNNPYTPSIENLPTIEPTYTSTPTLSPIGKINPIPHGYYYLGDKSKIALGFNMDAGGSIGRLLYNGKNLVDNFDYGRYIQLSYYDGSQKYEALGNDPFGNYGWDPIQAGSKTGVGAKVLDFRTTDDSVYIKSQGIEWGKNNEDSDIVFETWAWLRDGYFEVHLRSTHTGNDTHTWAWQEFPATYFSASLPIQYSYDGDNPFSNKPISKFGYFYDSHPQFFPTEDWVAYSNINGDGLILTAPPQEYLSKTWGFFHVVNSYSNSYGVGYAAPIGIFDNPPGAVRDITFYLIPGNIEQNRSLVYDLIPHTTWTFDLNSSEGWENNGSEITIQDGILETTLQPRNLFTSFPNLNIAGSITPKVIINAKSQGENSNICLQFITSTDAVWNNDKRICQPIMIGDFQTLEFNTQTIQKWKDSIITQIALSSDIETSVRIDTIKIDEEGLAWEFNSANNTEGWWAWNQLSPLQSTDGTLQTASDGTDPYMGSPFILKGAQQISQIQLSMKISRGNSAQLFFITDSDSNWDEAKSITFPIISDNQFHIYSLNLSSNSNWKGNIIQIRLDPTDTNASIYIDYFRMNAE